MSFNDFSFAPELFKNIEAKGYDRPTPIQKQAMAPVLEGRDVMGLAQTGTGKTAAFALPILQRLLDGQRGTPRALILAPTRELALQIQDSFEELGRNTGLHSTAVFGGVSPAKQVAALKKGVDIVVACPGRLIDLMGQGIFKPAAIEILVLDEADHMFDMGFLPDIRRILKQLPAKRQNLLFSATMPPDIRGLANEVLRNPVTVEVGHTAPVDRIDHALYPVENHLKTTLLMELLKTITAQSVLIFTKTKHRARRLGEKLVQQGHRAIALQGNLSQNRRQEAMDGFRSGKYTVMVATDIAARGIDVSQISHVINYDVPDTVEAYTHRTGRTARAERSGEAYTLAANDEIKQARIIEKATGIRFDERKLGGFDYNQPAPQRDSEFARGPRQQTRKPARPQAGRSGHPQTPANPLPPDLVVLQQRHNAARPGPAGHPHKPVQGNQHVRHAAANQAHRNPRPGQPGERQNDRNQRRDQRPAGRGKGAPRYSPDSSLEEAQRLFALQNMDTGAPRQDSGKPREQSPPAASGQAGQDRRPPRQFERREEPRQARPADDAARIRQLRDAISAAIRGDGPLAPEPPAARREVRPDSANQGRSNRNRPRRGRRDDKKQG